MALNKNDQFKNDQPGSTTAGKSVMMLSLALRSAWAAVAAHASPIGKPRVTAIF